MITTKIEVPPHLKEYLIGKFCNMQDSPIRFPDNTDIYHFIYDLLERRPCNVIDHGNLEIILPERSLHTIIWEYVHRLSSYERSIECYGQKPMTSWTNKSIPMVSLISMRYIISWLCMELIQSQRMHSKRTITGGEPKFAGKRKKEVIIAQKNSRASVVNCPFFDRKMFEKRLKNAY